jgi:hypothetical protein
MKARARTTSVHAVSRRGGGRRCPDVAHGEVACEAAFVLGDDDLEAGSRRAFGVADDGGEIAEELLLGGAAGRGG